MAIFTFGSTLICMSAYNETLSNIVSLGAGHLPTVAYCNIRTFLNYPKQIASCTYDRAIHVHVLV